MSRPFSYNDKNYTVIGNILFVNFKDNKQHATNEPVLEVPYEIFRRLVTFTNYAVVSVDADYVSGSMPISIKKFNDKPFIAFKTDRPPYTGNTRIYYCFYLLKNI